MKYMTTTSGQAVMELGARLGRLGRLAVGASGGGLAWMLARCAGCGAALAGADVLFHDGSTPACGAFLARRHHVNAAFFLEEDGCASVWLCDGQGRALTQGSLPPGTDWAGMSGTWDRLCGADSAYAARAVGGRSLDGVAVTVMDLPGQGALRAALERLGCEILDRPLSGVPLLRSDASGFALTVREGLAQTRPRGDDAVSAAVDWCLARAARPLSLPAFGENMEGGGV